MAAAVPRPPKTGANYGIRSEVLPDSGHGYDVTLSRVDRLRCATCLDVIGAYEPIVVCLPDGCIHVGSRASLRQHIEQEGSVCVHEACHQPPPEQNG